MPKPFVEEPKWKEREIFRVKAAYHLNQNGLKDAKIRFGPYQNGIKGADLAETHFYEFYNFLSSNNVSAIEMMINGVKFTSDHKEYVALSDDQVTGAVMKVLADIRGKGSTLDCHWFFTDYDSCRTDPHYVFNFFVVSNNTFVLERASIHYSPISGNWTNALTEDDDFENPWMYDDALSEAWMEWLYKRFYTETPSGQILAIRDNIYVGPPAQRDIVSILLSVGSTIKWMFWLAIIYLIFQKIARFF